MAYNETLAERIRKKLSSRSDVEAIKMMGGLVFMVDGKMCVGIMKEDLMCRVGAENQTAAIERQGCSVMQLGNKPMKGYVVVDETGFMQNADFSYWIDLALAYNPFAVASKKRKK